MVIIEGMTFEYRRLYRCVELARTLISKPRSQFKHFSFIMKGSKIVSIGWNDSYAIGAKIQNKLYTYPLGGVHAECNAIAELDNLDVCRRGTIVNVRINNKKQIRNSRPCSVCYKIMQTVGFGKIYYSTDTGFECLYL